MPFIELTSEDMGGQKKVQINTSQIVYFYPNKDKTVISFAVGSGGHTPSPLSITVLESYQEVSDRLAGDSATKP